MRLLQLTDRAFRNQAFTAGLCAGLVSFLLYIYVPTGTWEFEAWSLGWFAVVVNLMFYYARMDDEVGQ